uniref:Uncharacterized protein n=1 Tax=Leptospirillum ferrodiazotrophum TaxID=412449 RepID=C6HUZ4_9BACT|nr:MAG: hypothetical protein UBAL3_74420062 [Leptospirillum ferrodiazotrophum]
MIRTSRSRTRLLGPIRAVRVFLPNQPAPSGEPSLPVMVPLLPITTSDLFPFHPWKSLALDVSGLGDLRNGFPQTVREGAMES